MKFLIASSILFLGLTVWVLGYGDYGSKNVPQAGEKGPENQDKNSSLSGMEKFIFKGQKYRYAFINPAKLESIELIPNHQERLYTPELVNLYSCAGLVNGGFYGKDYAPIGWLISRGQEVSKPVNSDLLNGFVAVGTNGQVSIDSIRPAFNVREGVQSGPMLIDNTKPLGLKIRNDESRRRMVAALSEQGELSFWVVTGDESFFSGPLLADMPELMVELSKQAEIKLSQAINLDGGSASAFVSDKVTIREISSVGNFFCLH